MPLQHLLAFLKFMTDALEERLAAGDTTVFGELFTIHRPRIWQIIRFRISGSIRGRVDPDDVVQEVYLEAEKRLRHYIDGDFPSVFLWLRLVAGQTLSKTHRTHLGTESRTVSKESTPNQSGPYQSEQWGNTSLCLSQRFIAHITSPSQAAVKVELIAEVRSALETMNDIDREVLALRHFEELTNQEVAIELSIQPKAASIRYMRALERLRGVLEQMD